ncbi:52 kDa repressor of the inhibitor of the protein kinase-like [Monomorium pharaonis]|uniref:52 kDa repressor of the inhibitor of the protein kinase-like n=1 Tax=Monomorium pharaonis TaxID=307658 RepID=UPI001746828D|nr:52 kDa repressor of the inhibitor of the protein kinase-like [Monomorium pharaonis]
MSRRCHMCKIYWKKDGNISFHSIPKDPIFRKQWIEACKLHEIAENYPDKLSLIKICSMHFGANSFIPHNNNSNRTYLKSNAVPRLNIENNNMVLEIEAAHKNPNKELNSNLH